MVEQFKNMAITQANTYIEQDLKSWITSVCVISGECAATVDALGAMGHK